MGVWGPKIGDSDQALDVLEICCNEELYLKAQLNRNDVAYYSYDEESLCAVALVDASINGFDPKIWSNYVIENDYMKSIQNIIKDSPKWILIDDALNMLSIIERMNSGWSNKEDEKVRKEIIELLYERLCNTSNFITHELRLRKKEILTANK